MNLKIDIETIISLKSNITRKKKWPLPANLKRKYMKQSALGFEMGINDFPYCEKLYLLPFNHQQIIQAIHNMKETVRNGSQYVVERNLSPLFDLLVVKFYFGKYLRSHDSGMIISMCYQRSTHLIQDWEMTLL